MMPWGFIFLQTQGHEKKNKLKLQTRTFMSEKTGPYTKQINCLGSQEKNSQMKPSHLSDDQKFTISN